VLIIFFYTGTQVRNDRVRKIEDRVIREERFRLYLNGSFYTEMVASNEQLRELGAGFVICQGLARTVDNVETDGNCINVSAPVNREPEKELGSAGALGTKVLPERIASEYTITKEDVFRITREIETDVWKQTGGVHCSVLFHEGNLLVKSSDVGRHNTVDKVVGHAVLSGIDLSRCVVGCTGRQPRDMILKSGRAGIPIIISRAASTDKGIATAEEAGITLVCFSRDERFTVYTHPRRIRDLMD